MMFANDNPWENEYSRKGRVWGGSVHFLPPLSTSDKVLELGCGNGKTFAALLGTGAEITGVDFSLSAARLCRSLTVKSPKGEVIVADARHLPFTDASFDVVIAFHIMGHLPAEGRRCCAREAGRVLRPGGTLYFSGFSTGDFRAGTGCETEPCTFRKKNGISTHYFTEEDVMTLFGNLSCCSCGTRRWPLIVRGQQYPRAEIAAIFKKYPKIPDKTRRSRQIMKQ
jgi:SAM-dependent methyltransferase